MKYLSKSEVESLKVGDVICILDIAQSKLKDHDDRMTISEIIVKPDGSVKLRLFTKGVKHIYDKNKQLVRNESNDDYVTKPHIWKTTFSSSRMTKDGKVHIHASGENYTHIVVKPE